MNCPLISIIIPVYNGEKTLGRTIESCLMQTYHNYEIIIIDNASSDGTRSVVKSFNADNICYVYIPIKGRSNARNEGLARASGEYIQFVDADDILDREKLARSVRLIAENSASAVQCATVYVRGGKIINKMPPYAGRDFYTHLLTGNTVPIHSMMMKKSLCKQFPANMDYCEDWVFWIDSLKDAVVVFDTDYEGAIAMIHESNTMTAIHIMKDCELRVLLQYRLIRLPFRNAIAREVKILKRYIEYAICSTKKDVEIEENTHRGFVFAMIRNIVKNRYIKKFIIRMIQKADRANKYVAEVKKD